jgi:type IV pilus biogenesis protein CpaD/CtpE
MNRTRRHVANPPLVLVVSLVLLVAACNADGRTSASTTTTIMSTTSTAVPVTITTLPATTTTMAAASTTAALLPDNAADYAQAAFEAWLSGQSDRMQQLMTEDAYQVLAARAPSEGDRWGSARCEGAAGSTYCQWDGAVDNLVLRVENEAASSGDPQAIIEARFE